MQRAARVAAGLCAFVLVACTIRWGSAVSASEGVASIPTIPSVSAPPAGQPPSIVRIAGVQTVVSSTGGTEAECFLRCSTLRRHGGLCRRALWVPHRAACVLLGGNASVALSDGEAAADGTSDLASVSADDGGAALARFQRISAYAPPSLRTGGHPLLQAAGMPLHACLHECLARAENATKVFGRIPPMDVSDAAARATCRQVVWRAATEECVLRAITGEHLLMPSPQATTYALVGQPSTGAARDRNASDMASLGRVDAVAFVVLCGSRLVGQRLVPALRTWLAHQRALLLVEASAEGRVAVAAALRLPVQAVSVRNDSVTPLFPNPFGTGVVAVAFLTEPPAGIQRSFNGAWKNLAGIEPAVQFRAALNGQRPVDGGGDETLVRRPRWWFMVDDDTIVLPNALRHFLAAIPLRRRTPGDVMYAGTATAAPPDDGEPTAPEDVDDRNVTAAPAPLETIAADGGGSASPTPLRRRPTWAAAARAGTLVGRVFAGNAAPFNESSDEARADPWGTLERRLPLFASNLSIRVLGRRFERKMPDGKPHFPFVQGGAGILFDDEALQRMHRVAFECRSTCLQWAGDIRLSCCAVLANVSFPMHSTSFWSEHPRTVLGHPHTHRLVPFPVTFHKMRGARDVKAVWDVAEREAGDGRLLTWRALAGAVGWAKGAARRVPDTSNRSSPEPSTAG